MTVHRRVIVLVGLLLGLAAPAAAQLTNGGFEAEYAGWTRTGNQAITLASATEGTKAVVFNAGQAVPNGVLSQPLTTVAGQAYTLAFDVGAMSLVNVLEQRLQVTVRGTSVLLDQPVTVRASGTGTIYRPQTFAFTADGASVLLTFQDTSGLSTSVDLLLDNVRVLPQAMALVTLADRLAWDQPAPSLEAAAGYRYRYYADAEPAALFPTVMCQGVVSPFVCTTSTPAFPPGPHTVTITASTATEESGRSAPLAFTFVVVLGVPGNVRFAGAVPAP